MRRAGRIAPAIADCCPSLFRGCHFACVVLFAAPRTTQASLPLPLRASYLEDSDEQVMRIALAPPQDSPPLQHRASYCEDSDEQLMRIAVAPPQASAPLQLRAGYCQHSDEQVMRSEVAPSPSPGGATARVYESLSIPSLHALHSLHPVPDRMRDSAQLHHQDQKLHHLLLSLPPCHPDHSCRLAHRLLLLSW